MFKVSVVDNKAKGPECHNENWGRRNIRKHIKSTQNKHISRFYNGCTPVARFPGFPNQRYPEVPMELLLLELRDAVHGIPICGVAHQNNCVSIHVVLTCHRVTTLKSPVCCSTV